MQLENYIKSLTIEFTMNTAKIIVGAFTFVLLLFKSYNLKAQIDTLTQVEKDSIFIKEVESDKYPLKVLHAEPLYIDLIRDLGARKGEREWNIGAGITDNKSFDEYLTLIEYEWAPIDRLGLEIEFPFSFYYPTEQGSNAPNSKLQSLKFAAQYTFLVSDKRKTSLAIGHIQEFEMNDFKTVSFENMFMGNLYNPFLIGAKRWGQNFHTLIYTGPQFIQHYVNMNLETVWQINSNLHYMISGTRNFIGVEFNKELRNGDFDMVIRPQMRVEVTKHLLIGIVAGIPINKENERFSSFLRLIYEPKHK